MTLSCLEFSQSDWISFSSLHQIILSNVHFSETLTFLLAFSLKLHLGPKFLSQMPHRSQEWGFCSFQCPFEDFLFSNLFTTGSCVLCVRRPLLIWEPSLSTGLPLSDNVDSPDLGTCCVFVDLPAGQQLVKWCRDPCACQTNPGTTSAEEKWSKSSNSDCWVNSSWTMICLLLFQFSVFV